MSARGNDGARTGSRYRRQFWFSLLRRRPRSHLQVVGDNPWPSAQLHDMRNMSCSRFVQLCVSIAVPRMKQLCPQRLQWWHEKYGSEFSKGSLRCFFLKKVDAHLARLAFSLAFNLARAFFVFSLFTTDFFFSLSLATIGSVGPATSELPSLFLRLFRLLDSTGVSTLPSCSISRVSSTGVDAEIVVEA
jgi:hypothetical protein